MGHSVSDVTKQKMREAKLGGTLTAETRDRISKAKQGVQSRWKGGITFTGEGYPMIKAPWHPYARKDGYVLESHLVAEETLGRYFKPNEMVHHIDGGHP